MEARHLLISVGCAGFLGACAATVPSELVNARAAYRRASVGPAAQQVPADLHIASQALNRAEQSFRKDPKSYQTLDLSYVALRKSEIAEAKASIATERTSQSQAKSEYQAAQGEIIADAKQDLKDTRADLVASEHSGDMAAGKLSAEQTARVAAERRAAEAQAALAKLAAVKEEPRGMVITLSGSVLFASNRAVLLPDARSRLDQVSDVLMTTQERNLTIEGHTDSQGASSHNLDLSQRRANAVRDYLVQRGYQADRIQARGLGEGNPISDNSNAEGRANNRRVEIVISRDSYTSNP